MTETWNVSNLTSTLFSVSIQMKFWNADGFNDRVDECEISMTIFTFWCFLSTSYFFFFSLLLIINDRKIIWFFVQLKVHTGCRLSDIFSLKFEWKSQHVFALIRVIFLFTQNDSVIQIEKSLFAHSWKKSKNKNWRAHYSVYEFTKFVTFEALENWSIENWFESTLDKQIQSWLIFTWFVGDAAGLVARLIVLNIVFRWDFPLFNRNLSCSRQNDLFLASPHD